MTYAEVAVDAPVGSSRTFSYEVPPPLAVAPGQMVQVPFGPRLVDGLVFQVAAAPAFSPVKPLAAADPLGPLLSPVHLELARWISDYYLCSLYGAASLMLPPGGRRRTQAYLQVGSREALATLEQPWNEQLQALFARGRQRREEVVRRVLADAGPGADRFLEALVRQGVLTRSWGWRQPKGPGHDEVGTPGVPPPPEAPLAPTPEQAQALQAVEGAMARGESAALLLQGVTGSGKTEVYLQALAACLGHGRQGIVLVPEISLTPQALRRFQARFPGQVAVLHSRLSQAERLRMWWGIWQGRYPVVVGSRSAVFAPLRRLGLIVLDEEHEWTYKQHDAEPRYHARAVSLRLGEISGAVVLLGSATPDLVTYHHALSGGRWRLFSLPHRLGGPEEPTPLPLAEVQIVDMRGELREGHRSIFSRVLQQALAETTVRGQQAILFLNRRGAGVVVQCRDCGHAVRCRSCDLPLTYHVMPERLLCHQCNRSSPVPATCPRCRSPRMRSLGLGTQRVVQELQRLLPAVTILRWDRDVAATGTAHEAVLDRFGRGEAQVLVGTQMVAKGLHIPSVTLVGVVLADIGLNLPDFRAGERVFQLLCQVVGRAGRGGEPGRAVIQTYRPQHYAVAVAARQDYLAFYQQELAFRRVQRLPPFSRLIRLVYLHTNAGRCEGEVERLGRTLRHERRAWGLADVDVLGPAPACPARLRGRYRWQLLLRGHDPRLLLDKVRLPQGWVVDVDPVTLV
ncbi:MAG: primosomal protein N' [Chloroflexi bacterium]|nr:primosomal protein N' [Chloroflexota bacterium]